MFKRLIGIFMFIAMLIIVFPAIAAASDSNTGDFINNEVLIKADSLSEAYEYAKAYGATVKSYSEYGNFAVLKVTDAEQAVYKSKMSRSNLPKLSLNRIYKIEPVDISAEEPLPSKTKQTGITDSDPELDKQYFHQDMDTIKAWEITKGSSDVVVAVIDTGIDKDHPAFEGRISDKAYNSHTNVKGIGYVSDDEGHGTHVAGIIAAAQVDGSGACGVAPEVTILPIKANNPENVTDIELASVIRGIAYAVENGADIINMSFGDEYYEQIEKDAIEFATSEGVILVASAGNKKSPNAEYPAAYEECIAVSALKQGWDFDFSYSNYGPEIDIAAPGTDIYSTYPGGYVNMSGTSMAAPNVAGVAALIKSEYPELTVDQIKQKMFSTAKQFGILGVNNYFGHGVVNSYNALVNENSLVTVTYKYVHNDGQIENGFTSKVSLGSKLSNVFPKTREGYTFDKWYKEESCVTPFNFNDETINKHMTLYAKWLVGELVSPESDFTTTLLDGNSIMITRYNNLYNDVVVIPAYIQGRLVTEIGVSAFLNNLCVNKVTIPNSVTTIGNSAFRYCSSLKSITIPNSVTNIVRLAFEGCYSLEKITLPDNITVINDRTFYNCRNLRSINIPRGITSIGVNAFANCHSLESITLPDSLTIINGAAFNNCKSLTDITIPHNVTEIAGYAFQYCSSLTNVSILSPSITEIWDDAFQYCTNLKSISIFSTSLSGVSYYAFEGLSTEVKIYVVSEDIKSYLSARNVPIKNIIVVTNPPAITALDQLPNGKIGEDYYSSITATSDMPIIWRITKGQLPDGLNLLKDGTITGTPEKAGEYRVTIEAINVAGIDNKDLTIIIEQGNEPTYAQSPNITDQPEDVTVIQGNATSVSVTASVDKGELSYQWYSNTSKINTGGTLIRNATASTYLPNTNMPGTYYYYCVVTNTDNSATGIQTSVLTSDACMVIVMVPLDDFNITLVSNELLKQNNAINGEVTVNVSNNTQSGKHAVIIIAVYDNKDMMIYVDLYENVLLNIADNNITFGGINIENAPSSKYSIRVFAWESLSSQMPLAKCLEFDL